MIAWTDYEVAGLKAFLKQKRPLTAIYEAFSHRTVGSVQMKIREIRKELFTEQLQNKIKLLESRNSVTTALYNSYKVENRDLKRELKSLRESTDPIELKKLGYKVKVEVSK